MPHDSDNAWKGILHSHFKDCLLFFFPEIHDAIDWRKRPVFLDKELAKLVPDALRGKSLVDKPVQVRLRSGESAVVFVHVEVQSWCDPNLAARMLRYNALIRERHGDEVVSLAVLTDGDPRYRPGVYEYRQWDFSLRIEFPVAKLLDFKGREEELKASRNLFAVVVLAHLARLQARGVDQRLEAKLDLVRLLYRRGYTRRGIQALLRLLDWILRLPEDLEMRIIATSERLEHGKQMTFLSNIERWSIEKGLQRGLQKGLQKGRREGQRTGRAEGLHEAIAICLERRFGSAAHALLPRVRAIQSLERLRALVAASSTASKLADFAVALRSPRAHGRASGQGQGSRHRK